MLEVRGLTKSFGPRRVLDDVDLDIRPGELVALVGENGAGKSTMVKCIAGMLTPDRGTVSVVGGRMAVVWQDLALCDNLDAVANIFLGVERGKLMLDDAGMRRETQRMLTRLGLRVGDLSVPVGLLSGGQRQMVAVARSLMTGANVLLFDEPTAALGVTETAVLEQLLRRLRSSGIAVLMVSHRIEQVFALADRIAIMRHGRIISVVSPLEVHPDDVVAIMAGAKTESTARRQLSQLRSLVDQLAEVEPSASLPLILTSLSRSLSTPTLGLWMVVDNGAGGDSLVLTADVGLDEARRHRLRQVPIGSAGGVLGISALGSVSVATDAELDPIMNGLSASAWAVPVIGPPRPNGGGPGAGAHGSVLAVIAGFGDRHGHPGDAQLELVQLHANLATVAIERESMLDELTRRNHLLESLRGLLDRLAGPEPASGLSAALLPLRAATGADTISLVQVSGDVLTERASTSVRDTPTDRESAADRDAFAEARRLAVLPIASTHRAQMLDEQVAGISIATGDGRVLLLARWASAQQVTTEALDLLEDASRSLALALERQVAEHATQETQTLRRANSMQREFLHRLSHELRTPLTAIRGFADSLRHTDVDWDDASHDLFLERISTESSRMGRLVADLLDSSAIETGQLRLQMDWCDLSLVIDEAITVVSGAAGHVHADVVPAFPAVWADHDRIEQILVNVLENALRHGLPPITVSASVDPNEEDVVISVIDSGPGFAESLGDRAFEPHHRASGSPGAGLGLTIARGLAIAHGGSLERAPHIAPSCMVLRLPIEPAMANDRDGAHRDGPEHDGPGRDRDERDASGGLDRREVRA
ncbi:MAG: D-xylose transport ATP-binding protein XylG [Ilumatobacteraceae bacterium]|nr:D-xylose transport ATP-binding protein XylG [Ilumatobacteraceae bacterium]